MKAKKTGMDITKFWSRGIANSGLQQRADAEVAAATEQTRASLLAAISTDELRTWFDVGQRSPEPLYGLLATLSMAGLVGEIDSGEDCAAVRVIRGAMKALEDCIGRRQAVISADDARALSAAVHHAQGVLHRASHKAIQKASVDMRRLVGCEGVA